MPVRPNLQRTPKTFSTRPMPKRPAMGRRASLPTAQDGWKDIYEGGSSLEGHESPSQERRRTASRGRRTASASQSPNPFDMSFARSLQEAPVSPSAKRPSLVKAPAAADLERSRQREALWGQTKDFLARLLVVLMEDVLSGFCRALTQWGARQGAGALGSQAGASMGLAGGTGA